VEGDLRANEHTGWRAIGPRSIVVGLTSLLAAGWLSGVMLAPRLTPDEATRILRQHLGFDATRRIRAEMQALGVRPPDAETKERWSAELDRARSVRVTRVNTRPEIFWTVSRTGHCVARMELEAPPTQPRPVRYFRTECSLMMLPRILWETTETRFRIPI
jgi:hypothetical protein